ncbi:dolichyl-phosphate-mannose--protein mannosyltransferase [Naasia aerilata]|uniref:dolichyl-phosphate-mannose--protein mannosyltransferase n=1 Tax=Naasia aerilata TaxID=1162966 RepID=UPI002573C0AF|nr:phospholipid carrier-dependent glycosyltransferase [Naasia aerilata]
MSSQIAPARHLSTAVPLAGRPFSTFLDRVPRWRWLAPLLVTVLAAALRFPGLGHPSSLMFDETFYVKDAWTLLNLGYEGKWPQGFDDATFNAGHVWGFTSEAEYVAHPPLGKWLIGLGMLLFGPTDPFGWRFSVAVAGTLAVLLVALIGTTLFRSVTLGTLAAALFAVDGHAIVLSRVSLLDNFVMLFALLGFGAMLLDRRQRDVRLAEDAMARNGAPPSGWGPALAWRPWLLTAGVAFGLTCAVKWSGLYFLAGFAVYSVLADAVARRRAGFPGWLPATIVRQAPATFASMVPPALAAYLAAYTGWFLTSGGYDRNWIATGGGTRWTGLLAWVPDVLQNLWHWHAGIYAFHTGLSASHPYATPAILWPLLARPTQIYYRGSGAGENGCQYGYCSEIVWSIANPILWWAAVAATLYVVYRFARIRASGDGLILMGVAAGYLPWLLYPTRTMFQFYAIAFEPYLLLALVAVLGTFTGMLGEPPPERVARPARAIAAAFVVVVVLVSAFFYPLWTGMQTPFWFWQAHVWLTSWV